MAARNQGFPRGSRLRVLKHFSKFTNTVDSPILLDLDDEHVQEQKKETVHEILKGRATSGKGKCVQTLLQDRSMSETVAKYENTTNVPKVEMFIHNYVNAGVKEYVHILIQQRNGRKSLTTVQGLKKELSYEKILKDLKKELYCNGTVVQDKELDKVIQLQGDPLIAAGIVKKDQIKIHGF